MLLSDVLLSSDVSGMYSSSLTSDNSSSLEPSECSAIFTLALKDNDHSVQLILYHGLFSILIYSIQAIKKVIKTYLYFFALFHVVVQVKCCSLIANGACFCLMFSLMSVRFIFTVYTGIFTGDHRSHHESHESKKKTKKTSG